jgi:hypothetical protein
MQDTDRFERPGGFLRQVDEIKQELEKRESQRKGEQPEEWQDVSSEAEIEPKTKAIVSPELRKLLNEPKGEDSLWELYLKKHRDSLNPDTLSKVAILEKLLAVFKLPQDADPTDPQSLLRELHSMHLQDTRAYRKLEDLISQYRQAEDRLRHLYMQLDPDDLEDRPSGELRTVLNRMYAKVDVDRLRSTVKSVERLSLFPIFHPLKDKLGKIQERIARVFRLRAKFQLFLERYPKDRFKRILMDESRTEEARRGFKDLVEEYGMCGVRDEWTEGGLRALEGVFRVGDILSGEHTVKIDEFEKLCHLAESDIMRGYGLGPSLRDGLGLCMKIESLAKRIGRGADFEEAKILLDQWEDVCPGVDLPGGEELTRAIDETKKLLPPGNVSLPLDKLKVLRQKLLKAPLTAKTALIRLDQRIFRGEALTKKINQISSQELYSQYSTLLPEYIQCRVLIPTLETILQQQQRETSIIQSLLETLQSSPPTIVTLNNLKALLQECTLHKPPEIELLLANTEAELLQTEWQEAIQQGHSPAEATELLRAKFSEDPDYFVRLETTMTSLREVLRTEIQQQLMKKSNKVIHGEILRRECSKMQALLLFLRRLYMDSMPVKSGKSSVFEETVQGFLSLAPPPPPPPQALPSALTNLGLSASQAKSLTKRIEQALSGLPSPSAALQAIINMLNALPNRLPLLAQHISNKNFSPKLLYKLSSKSTDALAKIEQKLVMERDNRRRKSFVQKYLTPFEDPSLIDKKIKKLKPFEEFDGYSLDDASDPETNGRGKTAEKDEPYIPLEKIDEKDSICGDDEDDAIQRLGKPKKLFGGEREPSVEETPEGEMFLKVWEGTFTGEIGQKKVEVFSCASKDFIGYFPQLPKELNAKSAGRGELEDWLAKSLDAEQR